MPRTRSSSSQGGTWPATWNASTVITPSYGAIELAWGEHPHPDVDGHVLSVGTSPMSLTNVITVGNSLHWILQTLDPGHAYFMKITAYDEATGHTSLSQLVNGTTSVAPYALASFQRLLPSSEGSRHRQLLRSARP